MPDSSTLVSVRLPDDLRQEVDDLARTAKRSRSFIVKEAVAAYIDDQRAYRQAVDEALTQADKGEFVSGEAVSGWLRSWGAVDEKPAPKPDIAPNSRS